jgi:hypothetical protein
MELSIFHDFLVRSSDFSSAKSQVSKFLQDTTLIRYGSVEIDQNKSCSAENKVFWQKLDQGVAENKKIVENLIDELELCDYSTLQDLFFVKQGFESKILHTITHMLDGFIGVDSVFYSLIEDSHWLSPSLREEVISDPKQYWLVHVIAGEVQDAILHKAPLTGRSKA